MADWAIVEEAKRREEKNVRVENIVIEF